MEEAEYMKLADSIPLDWYSPQESVEITKSIFYDIMMSSSLKFGLSISDGQDMHQLIEHLALEKEIPEEEVIMNVKNIATTVGAVKIFTQKYPVVALQFPKNEFGVPDFPPKFLAVILDVTEDIALDLLNGVLKDYSTYLDDKNQE
jgi:hypothetical protein